MKPFLSHLFCGVLGGLIGAGLFAGLNLISTSGDHALGSGHSKEASLEVLAAVYLVRQNCHDMDELLTQHIVKTRVWFTKDIESMRSSLAECMKASIAKEMHKSMLSKEKDKASSSQPKAFAEQKIRASN